MEFYQSINHIKNHRVLEKVREVLKTIDFESLETGMHPIQDGFYYNVICYESTTPDNRVWESHKKEYDVHYIISGQERIHHNFIDQMHLSDYDIESDWQQMEGEAASEIVLNPGNILLLDANDAHKTGLKVSESLTIQKIVFKIGFDNIS